MSTFTTKYVKASNGKNVEVHVHCDGAVAQVHWYELENSAHIQFESGITVSVHAKNGTMTIYTSDDVLKRDLTSHPCWNPDRKESLVRIWTRQQMGRLNATREEIEFVKDVLLELNDLN